MSVFKNIICILSQAAVTATVALSLCPEKISAEEPEELYNIALSIETVEVDINDIPENREIKVGVYIENNPGFLGLSFILEKDSRLGRTEHFMFERTNRSLGITFHEFINNHNVTGIILSPNDLENLCYDNGILISAKVLLPENVSVGDFYSLNFLDYYEDEQTNRVPALARENSFDAWRVNKDFSGFSNGGIRITGQMPEETQPTEPEIIQPSEPEIIETQPPQPVIPNEPEVKQEETVKNEETEISETTTQISETTVTTVLTEKTETVSETLATTSSEIITDTVTTAVTSQTTESSEYTSDKDKHKEKTSVFPIAVLMGILVIGTGAFTFIIKRNKGKNNEDK